MCFRLNDLRVALRGERSSPGYFQVWSLKQSGFFLLFQCKVSTQRYFSRRYWICITIKKMVRPFLYAHCVSFHLKLRLKTFQNQLWIGTTSGGIFSEEECIRRENWSIHKCLRGHLNDVVGIAWSPDSNFLLSCSTDGTAIVFNVKKVTDTAHLHFN